MTAKPGQFLSYARIPYLDGAEEDISDDLAAQFPGAGEFVTFMNENGYESQREQAAKHFTVGEVLEVEYVEIGNSSSAIKFKGIPGTWNSVMFKMLEGY